MNKYNKLASLLNIPIFDTKRNYWFVRTQGGKYFDDFYHRNYIGIEWESIIPENNNKDNNEIETNHMDLKSIIAKVKEVYPKELKQTYIANQIDRFINKFKKGDIVLIPSKNSEDIAIGEIIDDSIYLDNSNSRFLLSTKEKEAPLVILKKRRRIEWIKLVHRNELDPYLQSIVYTHNTISDLNNYSLFIDRTLSDFYIKGETAFFTFKINKETNIPYLSMNLLNKFNESVILFIRENAYYPNLDLDLQNLICKINVQSRGPLQLSGPVKFVTIFGAICLMLFGGHVKYKDFEVETDGIVKSVCAAIETYNNYKENKEIKELEEQLKECQEQLELTAPDTTSNSNEKRLTKQQD